jgi:hypothetical protein
MLRARRASRREWGAEWGLWDPMCFDWWSEEELDLRLSTTRVHKTRAREELEAIVKAAGRNANENGCGFMKGVSTTPTNCGSVTTEMSASR